MYEGAITQGLKQLETGQPCLQQLQSRGKGGLFCSLAKATAEFSSPLIKHLPRLLSAPSTCPQQNLQPKGERSMAGCKPSLFPSQILTLSSRHRSASAAASPQAGGFSQLMVQAGALQPGGFLGPGPDYSGADSFQRVALPNTRDPEGHL